MTELQVQVLFTTQDTNLNIPKAPIMVPSTLKSKGLEEIVNHLLDTNLSLSFLLDKKVLSTSLKGWMDQNQKSYESILEIECIINPEMEESTFSKHDDWISSICVKDYTFTSSYDGKIRKFKNRKCVETIEAHNEPIKDLFVGKQFMATASLDHTVRIFNEKVIECIGHTKGVLSVDGTQHFVACGSQDHDIRVWDLVVPESNHKKRQKSETVSKTESVVLSGHNGSVTCVKFIEKSLLSSSLDHSLRLWDVESKTTKQSWTSDHAINSLSIKENTIATVHSDSYLRIWDLREQRSVSAIKGAQYQTSVDFSNTAYSLCATSEDLLVFDLRALKYVKRFQGEGYLACCFEDSILAGGKDTLLHEFK